MDDIQIEKKRRGRKPKTDSDRLIYKRGKRSTIKLVTIDENTNITDDIIVTHIPLSSNDINKLKFKINNEQKSTSTIDNIISFNDDIVLTSNNKEKKNINYYETKIEQLNQHISQLKKGIINVNKKLYKSSVNLVDENGHEWKDKTDIACWWCCHKFDTMPLGIPEYIVKGKFYLTGCFCSFNCMLAYNLDKNDYKIWDRQAMILQLKTIIDPTNNNIKPAPAREILSLFGGPLSIEEYRNSFFILNKEYRCILPPMASLTLLIEENNKDITQR